MGENYHLSSIAALLAKVVREQGRDDEALELLKTAEQLSSPNDIASQAFWRSMRAPILARQKNFSQAEELARAAVDLLKQTESPNLEADALSELALVLQVAGRLPEARTVIGEAIALYRSKGDLVSSQRSIAWARTIR